MSSLPLPANLERFPDLHPALSSQAALVEANRCLYCFDAPCTAACPTHIDVPRFIRKIATGNLHGSALTILASNILGLSCSRVCPVEILCEGACVLHRYNEQPIQIGRLQRHAMGHFYDGGARLPAPRAAARPGRIACIGGGPASLACAAELRAHGCDVTIFESRPLAGGLNTYGIAEYKLRPSDSLREVELIRSMGVRFETAEVGRSVSIAQIEAEYDLIFLGAGLGAMRRLGIPGEDLAGVIDALTFIADYKTAGTVDVGKRVAVIGGGNTAIDAANAARRLGAEEVHVLYRRSEKHMPAFSFEYQRSRQEGVRFHWLVRPVAIHASDSAPQRAGAVECVRVDANSPDGDTRPEPVLIPGSNFLLACDMVIPALGQSRLWSFLEADRGIQFENKCVAVDRATGQTANPRYFAGGDCVNGGREVVDAVAGGKRAARAMIRVLEARHG